MFTVFSSLHKLCCLILSRGMISPILQLRDPGLTDEERLARGHGACKGGSLHKHCPRSPHRTRTTQILSRVSGRGRGVWGEEQLVRGEAPQTDGRTGEQGGGGAEAAVHAQVCISGVHQCACVCVWLRARTGEVGSRRRAHRSRTNLPPPDSGSRESQLLS